MFAEMIFEGVFDFIPAFDFKKIWSGLKVDQPVRPTVDGKIDPTAWIRERGDRFPEGLVYAIPDGRYFYVPLQEGTGDLLVNKAEQLLAPAPSLLVRPAEGNIQPPSELGPRGGKPEAEAQKFLLMAYYGRQEAADYFPKFSLI